MCGNTLGAGSAHPEIREVNAFEWKTAKMFENQEGNHLYC